MLGTSGGRARLRLPSGIEAEADLPAGYTGNGRATIVVRPEHARLVPASEGVPLVGDLENVVYFGTDTHYHIRLERGGAFTVRMQNARGAADAFPTGDRVGIELAPGAIQMLRD